jgi:xylulokinase
MEKRDELVLGIDLGTSYFKAALFGRNGDLRGLGRAEVLKDTGQEGICELPVERFWHLIKCCIADAIRSAGSPPDRVSALAYSSQANSFLLLDSRGAPLTPLVLWPDMRAAGLLEDLRRLTGRADFLQVTGLGLETEELCAAKLLWFQRRHADLWARASRLRTISDFFISELTGSDFGDEGTASLLGFWDLRAHAWWSEALDTLGIRPSQLSQPLAPGAPAGAITSAGAERTGLPQGVWVAVGSLDHHVAAIGAGIGGLRDISISLGIVVACLSYLDTYRPLAGCCMGRGAQLQCRWSL